MSRNRKFLTRELTTFIRQYGRKHRPGYDPNDRNYDRGTERALKRISPLELDRMMHGDDGDVPFLRNEEDEDPIQ